MMAPKFSSKISYIGYNNKIICLSFQEASPTIWNLNIVSTINKAQSLSDNLKAEKLKIFYDILICSFCNLLVFLIYYNTVIGIANYMGFCFQLR